MADPNRRVGNLNFNFHKGTNESLKRLRKPKNSSLGSSSLIFNASKNAPTKSSPGIPSCYSETTSDVSSSGEPHSSNTSDKLTYENNDSSTFSSMGKDPRNERTATASHNNYYNKNETFDKERETMQSYNNDNNTGYSETLYGRNQNNQKITTSDNSYNNITGTKKISEHGSHRNDFGEIIISEFYIPKQQPPNLDKLFEEGRETKFFPDSGDENENANTEPAYVTPSNETSSYQDDYSQYGEEDFNTPSSYGYTAAAITPKDDNNTNASLEDYNTTSKTTNETSGLQQEKDTVSHHDSPSSIRPKSSLSTFPCKAKTSVGRSVSFLVPERRSFDEENGRSVATRNNQNGRNVTAEEIQDGIPSVARSNSKHLIHDDNDLKSLFNLARSDPTNEQQDNLQTNISDASYDEEKRNTTRGKYSNRDNSNANFPKTVRRLTFNKGNDRPTIKSREEIDSVDSTYKRNSEDDIYYTNSNQFNSTRNDSFLKTENRYKSSRNDSFSTTEDRYDSRSNDPPTKNHRYGSKIHDTPSSNQSCVDEKYHSQTPKFER